MCTVNIYIYRYMYMYIHIYIYIYMDCISQCVALEILSFAIPSCKWRLGHRSVRLEHELPLL